MSDRERLLVFFLGFIFKFAWIEGNDNCCGITQPTGTMHRRWECGVCTAEISNHSCYNNTCKRVFSYTMDSSSCSMAEDKCADSSRVAECPVDNFSKCTNLYKTEFRCTCKPNYIGNYCNVLKPKFYFERSEGWVMFLQHTTRYKNEMYVDVMVVAQDERYDPARTTVVSIFNSQGGSVLLTKPSKVVSADDDIFVWCRVDTTLADYCHRLKLILKQDYNKGRKIYSKNIYFFHAPFPVVHGEDPSVEFSQSVDCRMEYIGYLATTTTLVMVGLLKPPYFKRDEKENLVLYKRTGETYFNCSNVDMTCVPELSINQHSVTSDIATQLFRNQPLYLSAIHKTPRSNINCWQGTLQEWRIWELNYNKSPTEGVTVFYSGKNALTISKYSFSQSAVYYISFHTENFLTSGERFHNYKGAWFEIVEHPLFIHVPYTETYVNTEDVNTIWVEARDENMDPSEVTEYLEYYWYCEVKGPGDCKAVEQDFGITSTSVTIPPYTLKVGSLYNITITVIDTYSSYLLPVTRHVYLTVGERETDLINLQCSNDDCVMLPEETNYIYVISNVGKSLPKNKHEYKWEYTKASQEDLYNDKFQWKSADNITIQGTSVYTLKIKPNVLEYGSTYLFKASAVDSRIFSSLFIQTPAPPQKLNCTVTPEEGRRGTTDFSFNCHMPREPGSVYFEFYDKESEDDHLFSGRMLGYSNDGTLSKCKLTAGVVTIFAYNYFSVIARYTFKKIELQPFNGTLDDLGNLMTYSQDLVEDYQYDFASREASVLAIVLEPKMNPSPQIIKFPVLMLKQIPTTQYFPRVKMVLSSLKHILETTTSKFDIFKSDADLPESASIVLLRITSQIIAVESEMDLVQLTYKNYLELIKTVIDCAEMIIMQKNLEALSKPEEYVRPAVGEMILQTSYTITQVLYTVIHSLSRTQRLGDYQMKITSAQGNVTACVVVTWLKEMTAWSEENSTIVHVSAQLADSIGKPSEVAAVMYVKSYIDIFWWARGNTVTEFLSLNFCKRKYPLKCISMKKFSYPLSINLKVIKPLDHIVPIDGYSHSIDLMASEEEFDLTLTVYRFFMRKRAKLYLKFIINASEEYKVLVVEGIRPDKLMMKNAITINASSPEYHLEYNNKGEGFRKIYYMGILPGGDVSQNKSLSFSLKAYYVLCLTWLRWYYDEYGCWVGNKTDETSVQCDCDHLSHIAATIDVPQHDHLPLQDFPMFLTPWENLVFLLMLLVLLFLYMFLLVLGLIWDKKDEKKREVIVLEDNFPGEDFGYLVAVYTGSKINSGTSASVGIRLFCDKSDSRPHILTCRKRQVMRAFSDDWFLLYCPTHLGRVRKLHIWHNNEGYSPDWYVEKIEVYDLESKLKYTFKIHDWISVEANKTPELLVSPHKVYPFFNVSELFYQNLESCLQDTHLWISILLKHPRNPVSRVARIHVVACFLLVVFTLCLVFYFVNFGFDIKEDEPSFTLTHVDILIFIIAYLMACLVSCSAMSMFRKGYPYGYHVYVAQNESEDSVTNMKKLPFAKEDRYSFSESDQLKYKDAEVVYVKDGLYIVQKPRHDNTVCGKLKMMIHKTARGSLLLPVTLQNYELKLIVNRGWCFAAWIFCGIIIAICIVTILALAWRLPTVKTEKYLFTFLGVVLADALLVSLLKIIIFSLVLSIFFQGIVPATSYSVRSIDGRRMSLFGNPTFLKNLTSVRETEVYFPLPNIELTKMRAVRLRRDHLWSLLDFSMVLVLAVVMAVTLNIYVIERFPANDHVNRMMARSGGGRSRRPTFLEVDNRTEYHEFLQMTYVDLIYRFMWYNFMILSNPRQYRDDWTQDCITRLLSNSIIRQIRAREGECRVSSYFKNTSMDCVPSYDSSVQDTATYSTRWIRKIQNLHPVQPPSSPWEFVSTQRSNSSTFYGPTGVIYRGAGYIANLGYHKRKTRTVLQSLDKKGWLDHRTRAVFVEFTIYNVNLNIFTQVVLITEQLVTGEHVSRIKVESMNTDINFDFWNISFILVQVFFLFRAIYFMNRNGICVYLSSDINKFEVFLLILGLGTVMLYVIYISSSLEHIQEHLRKGWDEFFSFFIIVKNLNLSRVGMEFWFLCVMIKVLLLWRFGRIFFAFYYSLLSSRAWIVWLTLCYMICICVIRRFIMFLSNIFLYPHLNWLFVYKTDFGVVHSNRRIAGVLFYLICFISHCVVTLCIASFVHFYKVGKGFNPPATMNSDLNYASFLREEIVNLMKFKKKPKQEVTAVT